MFYEKFCNSIFLAVIKGEYYKKLVSYIKGKSGNNVQVAKKNSENITCNTYEQNSNSRRNVFQFYRRELDPFLFFWFAAAPFAAIVAFAVWKAGGKLEFGMCTFLVGLLLGMYVSLLKR